MGNWDSIERENLWMMAAFSVVVVTAIYKPFAPVIIAELAPDSFARCLFGD